MTVYELASRLHSLNDPDMTGYGPAERLAQIERIIGVVHSVLVDHRSHLARDKATLTTTSGTAYVSLPSDFFSIHSHAKMARIEAQNQDIAMCAPEDLDTPSMEAAGVPTHGYPEGDYLYLGPIPNGTYSLKFRYYTTAPAFTTGGESKETDAGATAIMQANDMPWSDKLNNVIIPAAERLLVQKNEYRTKDLEQDINSALEPMLAILDRSRHDKWEDSGLSDFQDVGL